MGLLKVMGVVQRRIKELSAWIRPLPGRSFRMVIWRYLSSSIIRSTRRRRRMVISTRHCDGRRRSRGVVKDSRRGLWIFGPSAEFVDETLRRQSAGILIGKRCGRRDQSATSMLTGLQRLWRRGELHMVLRRSSGCQLWPIMTPCGGGSLWP